MNMSGVREHARAVGLTPTGRVKKSELIRAIQQAENNTACFGSSWRHECQEQNCCWRPDCLTRNPG